MTDIYLRDDGHDYREFMGWMLLVDGRAVAEFDTIDELKKFAEENEYIEYEYLEIMG